MEGEERTGRSLGFSETPGQTETPCTSTVSWDCSHTFPSELLFFQSIKLTKTHTETHKPKTTKTTRGGHHIDQNKGFW